MADYAAHDDGLKAEEISVFFGSVDPLKKAVEQAGKIDVQFPFAYGMDVEETSAATGAFYEEKKKFLHATGFLIGPDNKIIMGCYSTGSMGRLAARDVINFVKFLKSDRKKEFHMVNGQLEVR